MSHQSVCDTHQKHFFSPIITNTSMLSLLNSTGSLTETECFGQMDQRLIFSSTNVPGRYCVKRGMDIPPTVKYGGGFVMLCGPFFSQGPGNHDRVDSTVNS
ncbi:hypothetical protein ILYODFUR_033316 [Ilyodon furcidens]|uniref:Uncharacterized protein n=1 Tax=Ilyodon furcidens TaxID=33524 RepID=A0ABV0T4P5_9TELE